ncbi:MAG TPA: exopolysaccharide biosynthesis polyprenyl glycosylphosphotransferase [Chthoniobacterales bacterium]|jgi:exopolysaccharide biosynthesis polyprenyl glycosylphosphotransferase
MLNQRILGLHKLVAVCQIALALVLFVILYMIIVVDFSAGEWFGIQRYAIYALLVGLSLSAEGSLEAKSSEHLLDSNISRRFNRTVRQVVYITGTITVFLVLTKDLTISRPFLLSYGTSVFLLLYYTHRVLPEFIAQRTFKRGQRDRAILIGPVQNAVKLKTWLGKQSQLGYETVGVITEEAGEARRQGFKVLGTIDQTETLLQTHQASLVILTELPFFSQFNRHLIALCESLGVRLLIYSDIQDKLGYPLQYFADGDHRFFTLREEPLENVINAYLKRGLDIAISLPVCLFVLPVTSLIVAICHRLQSPGPLLYRQQRAGMQNRTFIIKKYRTMNVHNQPESKQATIGDSRIFPLGAILRKLSIDEFPQFLNVLSGEMSIVGPRPHLIEHNQQFSKFLRNYHIRTLVKPGITGLAQVRGFRGEAKEEKDIERRVAADIEYLENWKLSLEISIIWGTFLQIFRPPKTAY